MSISQRIYRIAKSQINSIRERLEQFDREMTEGAGGEDELSAEASARKELADAIPMPKAAPRPPVSYPRVSPPVTTSNLPKTANPPPVETNPLAPHYRLFGLEPDADFEAVQSAYQRLKSRCDPSRFPNGSEEQHQATEILQRMEAAYSTLRQSLDPTSGRFDKLEL